MTDTEIEVYAMQAAHLSIRDVRMLQLISHLGHEDVIKVLRRSTEIANERLEAAADELDRLTEEVRVDTFGPDRPINWRR